MVAPTYLKSLQALEMAIRRGSLKAAAEALAITPAAVGQRVKVLEDYLGFPLLLRSRTGLRPSPEIEGALPHLASAFRALDVTVEQLDMQRGHELQIAAVPDFADLWLLPRLSGFRAHNAHVTFCINGEGDAALRLGPADCEITFGPWQEQERTDLLFRDYLLPVSSPATRRRIGRLKAKTRLEGYPLLHLDFYRDDPRALNWPQWIAANRLKRTAPERGIRFRRIIRAVDAILADAGLSICGLALLERHIEDGSVILPFAVGSGGWTSHGFQARFAAHALARPQVRRFRQWLTQEARLSAAWLAKLIEAA
ncbi:MAG TPA: LysR family transcriptional regulator [Steroidobacteraceae bacterium]|nr:LysR family transcriptional regulator [Steroidobacteraceae bacterium]